MIEKNVRFTVADVDQKMSTFLQQHFAILLGGLTKDAFESVKLAKVEWDQLVANPNHWENHVFKPPEN